MISCKDMYVHVWIKRVCVRAHVCLSTCEYKGVQMCVGVWLQTSLFARVYARVLAQMSCSYNHKNLRVHVSVWMDGVRCVPASSVCVLVRVRFLCSRVTARGLAACVGVQGASSVCSK